MYVIDDLLAWMVGLLAEASRKKLIIQVLGTDELRALRPAVQAAVAAAAAQLAPTNEQADQVAMAVGEVFRDAPKVTLAGQTTLLEALQAGIATTLAVLDDPNASGGAQSSIELLGVPAGVLAETLVGHLVREIVVRGSRGGPLAPLADQLNHDVTHLQGQRLEGMLAQMVSLVTTLGPAGGGPQVPRKPVRLAPRPARLAGREDLLAELDARLTGDDATGPRMVALCGLGGAGKTSVAVEYAHRHLADVGLAWQFPAEDTTLLTAGFAELAAQLGARDAGDTPDPVASVHGTLAAFRQPWLLIFDNVPDLAEVQRFLPSAGLGRVLITSRNPNWPPGQVLDVPVLDTETAVGFLLTRTGDVDEQAATELAGELGGLPLALEQAGAYVQASGGSLAGYLTSFRQRRPEMLARGTPTGYHNTVAATWSLAFTELEQSAPQAVGLLRLLAFCAPEPIPVRLLLRPVPGIMDRLADEVAPVLEPLLEDELAAGDAVAALRRYSLVTPAGEGLVSVYRLVQAVTADQMSIQVAAEWRRATATVIEAAIPNDADLPQTWPDFAALLPHAQTALAPESGGMARIANYLGKRGNYAAARELHNRALDVLEQTLGPEHVSTLVARYNLARWTGEAGDVAGARDQFEALLPVFQRVLGPDHPHSLAVKDNLARWTGEAGDAAAARDQFEALLPVMERVLGPDHPGTLTSRTSLARWTGKAGDEAGARDQYAALLPVLERLYGPEHPDTLATRSSLAEWTGEAGDRAGARDQFEALLPVQAHVLGLDHPDTLTTRRNLAGWTGEAGDAAAARDQFEALLPIQEQVLGPKHPGTMATRRAFAYWIKKAG